MSNTDKTTMPRRPPVLVDRLSMIRAEVAAISAERVSQEHAKMMAALMDAAAAARGERRWKQAGFRICGLRVWLEPDT